jgi:hypothetical protein
MNNSITNFMSALSIITLALWCYWLYTMGESLVFIVVMFILGLLILLSVYLFEKI